MTERDCPSKQLAALRVCEYGTDWCDGVRHTCGECMADEQDRVENQDFMRWNAGLEDE